MNIDDLQNDIEDMEEEEGFDPEDKEYCDMCAIAEAYNEDDEDLCRVLMDKFQEEHGYKINIM